MLFRLLCALIVPVVAVARPPSAKDFELHPDCVMNLFAAEPDVASPSALCFDADGRCFVTEMLDYPSGMDGKGKPGGRVRMLLDANRDGRAEKSVIFAEGLAFPTSICAVRDGVIVAAPPEIVFFADRDGDGKAEVREVWFTGFVRRVTDSNFNGLRFGPDGLIHGVNGGNGGVIFCPPKGKTCGRLENDDFAFDPVTLEFRRTFPTSGGFGLCFDEAGRSFVTHNINHLQMRILPQRILDEVPGGSSLSGTRNVSVHGENCRIYPIADAATRPNHPEQAGYFSSAGGVGCLAHRGWPEGLRDSLFTCDAASGIVHRELPQPDGPIVKTARAPGEEQREFLAGRDPSFRPVGVELGPDGALYIIDMQRDVIEHPDYIPPKMKEKVDLRAGADRGRIWRILPKAGLPKPDKLPAKAKIEDRVKLLGSANQWTRLTAQRLLLEQRPPDALRLLHRAVAASDDKSSRAPGAVHALRTLAALGQLTNEDIAAAASSSSVALNIAAVQTAAQSREDLNGKARNALNALSHKTDPELAWHCLLQAKELRMRLRALHALEFAGGDEWMRAAALRSLGEDAGLAVPLVESGKLRHPDAIRDVAGALRFKVDMERLLCASGAADESFVAAMQGTLRARRISQAPLVLPLGLAAADRPVTLDVLLSLEKAGAVLMVEDDRPHLLKPDAPVREEWLNGVLDYVKEPVNAGRPQWLRLLRHYPFSKSSSALLDALHAGEDPALQQAALDCLRERRETAAAERLVKDWRTIAPALRTQIGAMFIDRREWRPLLAGALEAGTIATGELNPDLEQRRTLLRHSGGDLQKRFAKFFTDDEYSNRRAVVDEWLAKLPAKGDAEKGRAVFTKLCAQCHKAGGEGHNVGPDLTAQAHRSVEDLLSHILDPDMALNPNYTAMLAETSSGQRHTGILVRSGARVVLRQAMGVEVELPRQDVKSLESTGHSLMPQGLESAMTPAELRDVIAFLQSNR